MTAHTVPGAQTEFPDLGGGHINIIRTRQIGIVGRAQKTETIHENLQRSFSVSAARFFYAGLQQTENKILPFQPAIFNQAQLFSQIGELLHGHGLHVLDRDTGPVTQIGHGFIGNIKYCRFSGRLTAPRFVGFGLAARVGAART